MGRSRPVPPEVDMKAFGEALRGVVGHLSDLRLKSWAMSASASEGDVIEALNGRPPRTLGRLHGIANAAGLWAMLPPKTGIDGKECIECGLAAQCQHHIIPKSRGGKATVYLCHRCHRLAHAIDYATLSQSRATP